MAQAAYDRQYRHAMVAIERQRARADAMRDAGVEPQPQQPQQQDPAQQQQPPGQRPPASSKRKPPKPATRGKTQSKRKPLKPAGKKR